MITNLRATIAIARSIFHRKRGTLLAFAAAMALFQYIVTASYPAIGGDAAVSSVVQTFPPGLRRLLRIAPNLQAGFNLRDYLALGLFHPVFLGLGAAFVVGRATDALAGSIECGAIYLILSRPIPRSALVIGAQLEMIVGAGLLALISWLGIAIGVWTTDLGQTVPLDRYLLIALLAWALFAALGAGALVVSSLDSRGGRAAGIGSAWTLISFVLDVLPAIAESPLGMLNPWHHYDPPTILASGALPLSGIVVLLGWIIGGGLIATIIFARRDLV